MKVIQEQNSDMEFVLTVEELRRLHAIEEAAKNLVKVKGRFHTEQAFNKLQELLDDT